MTRQDNDSKTSKQARTHDQEPLPQHISSPDVIGARQLLPPREHPCTLTTLGLAHSSRQLRSLHLSVITCIHYLCSQRTLQVYTCARIESQEHANGHGTTRHDQPCHSTRNSIPHSAHLLVDPNLNPTVVSMSVVQPLHDIWNAAAGQQYEPTISKNTQFTLGFSLLFFGIAPPVLGCSPLSADTMFHSPRTFWLLRFECVHRT